MEEKEFSWVREIISTAVYLLAVVAVTFLFVQFVGQRTHVNGDSMNVTLEDGDNLIVDKLSYRFSEPERYDIIVFPYQYQEKTYYIKRIIGMPGETVDIKNGVVLLNGSVLDEEYYDGTTAPTDSTVSYPVTVADNCVFVMGDNRPRSKDSRSSDLGLVPYDALLGKAQVRIWPLTEISITR